MSHAVYNALWREAQSDLAGLTAKDQALGRRKRETDKRASLGFVLVCGSNDLWSKDRMFNVRWVLRLYADYIRITRTLDECHDQLVHPQKRILVRKLLEGCIGRLLELKHELLTELDKSNFHYFDDLLIERRLTYEDLEIPSPRFYYREREIQLQERRETIDRILAKMAEEAEHGSTAATEHSVEPPALPSALERARRVREQLPAAPQEPVETPEQRALQDAVRLIQRHERARQNRIQSYTRQTLMKEKYRPDRDRRKGDPAVDTEKVTAATMLVQRVYRRYIARKRRRRLQEHEDELIGLIMRRPINYSYRDRISEVQALRRDLRRQLEQAYEAAIQEEREYVDRVLSPEIFEDIGDELREWMRVWFYDVCKLPKFPAEKERKITSLLLGLPRGSPKDMFPAVEPTLPGISPRKVGGSNLITGGFWASRAEFRTALEKMKKGKGKKAKKPSSEEKRERKKNRKEAKKAEKQRKAAEKQRGFQLEESVVMPALNIAEREYAQEWEWKRPDSENPTEDVYTDLIREAEVHTKQAEVRLAVDELMRAELELLKDAEWREKHKRRKKKRRKRKKKKKKKKRRKGKRKKKDLTGDKTTDELLETLVRVGAVKNSPIVHMEDFFGEPSYSNFELRQRLKDPLPALGDIRQAVREYCVLPLGSERVHQLAPLVKSVLLAGPSLCGKSLLADIVCTETGALRMELTPEVVAQAKEHFSGKKGMVMFMHIVNKVARLMQPTVIVMDKAHRNYYRKVPKEERPLKPKKFARQLKKLARKIKKRDQILILGETSEPWRARGRRLVKAYQRHIFVPPMDHGSRSLMWHKLLMDYPGVDRMFEVTPLAHVTAWLPLTTMREAVQRTLQVERRVQLQYRPLQHQELLTTLLSLPAVPTVKVRKKWIKWWNKTPVQRKRAKLLAEWQKAENTRNRRRR